MSLGREFGDGEALEPPAHGWEPQSLIAMAANPPEPPTIGGLLYPGKRVLLSGETESLKTWFAAIITKAELDAGFSVAWADLDAMGPGELLQRLRALGVRDDVIDKQFLYYQPSERLVDERLVEVCGEIADRRVRLFVIDAFNGMLNLHGLDPGSTSDIETFWREVATPITDAGAAPTLLDHVTKNPEGRGKYAYGSERKASGAIVHIGFRVVGDPLRRGGSGKAVLTTHKDRPGFLPRPVLGRLVLDSDGVNVTYVLEEDRSHVGDRFRPTMYMQRISVELERQDEARPKDWIEKNVTGKADPIRTAIDVLVEEGFVVREETSKGHYFTSVRPYREDDDRGDEEPGETSSLPRPYLVPSLCSTPSRDLVPSSPLKGTRTRSRPNLVPPPRPRVGTSTTLSRPS